MLILRPRFTGEFTDVKTIQCQAFINYGLITKGTRKK